ncbi:hypothetical protein [Pseudomonas lactis]|uniref:hypothetical protein n=1 Tax=Pseudomonas lactis TaxID=1615674 RepID=UPI003F820B16
MKRPSPSVTMTCNDRSTSAEQQAALRYQWLRDKSLITGLGNGPMVRMGMGDPVSGPELDAQIDLALLKWPLDGRGITARTDIAGYEMSPQDAHALAQLVSSSSQDRVTFLEEHLSRHGTDNLVKLFVRFVECADSVITNCKSMAELLLITEGGVHPHVAEEINMPSLLGALNGVVLAANVDPAGTCAGCAYRIGTAANQSLITTQDAAYVRDEHNVFFCHENVPEGSLPTQICIGHAKCLKARGVTGDDSLSALPSVTSANTA